MHAKNSVARGFKRVIRNSLNPAKHNRLEQGVPGRQTSPRWIGFHERNILGHADRFRLGNRLVIGTRARRWLEEKFKISPHPNPEKLFWRVWMRWGLPGLALLAPVTCGPYFAALIALALGEKPQRLLLWIALGVIPWCVLFAVMADSGSRLLEQMAK